MRVVLRLDSFVVVGFKIMARPGRHSSPRRATKKTRRRSSKRQRSYRSAAQYYRRHMGGETYMADLIFREHWQHMYDSTITATRFPTRAEARPLLVPSTSALTNATDKLPTAKVPTAEVLPTNERLLPLVFNKGVKPKRIHISVVLADENDDEVVINVDARPHA